MNPKCMTLLSYNATSFVKPFSTRLRVQLTRLMPVATALDYPPSLYSSGVDYYTPSST
ncbi:hypothetical protein DAPPUDRAFT_238267 [Daphnia pulex]|uniref:Uncharacterized protein n=1 Tax=Daphnia pulex TaxID=6669 RepID=E9G5Z3_DAPPU|nr:hypothetical protein DAPPUDRAFT_238267 [Daphnia pulex]|eukprot:EFX84849.1 hypothetical protein DAPPUDRAFT_238267 [Daphnia pulex]